MPKQARYQQYEFAREWKSVSTVCGVEAKPHLYSWYGKLGWVEANRINTESKQLGKIIDNEVSIVFRDEIIEKVDTGILKTKEAKQYYDQALKNFYKIIQVIKPESVLSQYVVYSKIHKYIGTFDRLMKIDGKLVLADWKTTNYLDYGYTMQLEAYYRALIEMSLEKLILPEEFQGIEWHEKPLWLIQFPKKEPVDLSRHIVKFNPSELRFDNFKHLLAFCYGKEEDIKEEKLIDYKPIKQKEKK
jgi:hypothetical protein